MENGCGFLWQLYILPDKFDSYLSLLSDDLTEKEIEIKLEISKKAGLLRKPIKFTDVPGRIDESIPPNEKLWMGYIDRNPVRDHS